MKRLAHVEANGKQDDVRWGILCRSIHDVLALERVFRERAIWYDLVPVPRTLSPDCGMAIEFLPADSAAVRELLAASSVKTRGTYRRTPSGCTQQALPE